MTMTIPGGPGNPNCAVPIVDVSRPLAPVPPANRGATKVIDPPFSLAAGNTLASTRAPVVDLRSWAGCATPEALIVSLGRSAVRTPNGPTAPPDVPGFILPRIRAHVRWGVGGSASFEALVDWQHGTQLTIGAEYVQVEAIYDVVTEPWAFPTDFDPCDLPVYNLAAGVSYGSVAVNSNPARLTEIVQIETPGAPETIIAIPPFATSFTAFTHSDVEIASVRQVGFGTSYATEHQFSAPTDPTDYCVEDAIPIWNGAETLRISNLSDGGPLHLFIVFGLTLG